MVTPTLSHNPNANANPKTAPGRAKMERTMRAIETKKRMMRKAKHASSKSNSDLLSLSSSGRSPLSSYVFSIYFLSLISFSFLFISLNVKVRKFEIRVSQI